MGKSKGKAKQSKIVKVRYVGTVDDFIKGERVIYLPQEAEMDEQHEKCERGEVSSADESFVYVVYDNDKSKAIKTNPMYLIHEV